MHTVSIIIPVYNTEKYLPKCLDSILNQSADCFEVLLVDDGSTDNSGIICDEYANKDKRVRVFHKTNGGASSARNLGLDCASGEWVFFIDSDDELFPEGLKTMVDCITDDVDIVLGGYNKTDENGMVLETYDQHKTIVLSKRDSLLTLYNGYSLFYPYLGYGCIRLYRNSIIQKYRIRFDTDIIVKEDTLFIVQYICKSNGITIFTTTPVYNYIIHDSSAMSSLDSRYNPAYVTSMDAVIKMHSEIHQLPECDRCLSKAAKYEVVQRIYFIYGHMIQHNAVDRKELNRLKKMAIREVGLNYYMEFQYHRNRRRARKFIEKSLKIK